MSARQRRALPPPANRLDDGLLAATLDAAATVTQYGKLRWCTDRRRIVAEFWLVLALARIVDGRLARRAWAGTAGKAVPAAHAARWRRLGRAAVAQG